ncbi:SUMF1/EgtB/PvdO family nonheme iron enzyme [Methanosarcina sp. Mfa9]|uniref:formylglycine-generating enzyme family protein n=1 Tax=Methanosarcina sp. Mfa9 TaxID=3439063 RepID=UPI003F857F8D
MDLEIKRGYEVLPDNTVRFGIRVSNSGNSAISDVEVILDYNDSLFELEGNIVEKLGTLPPSVPRTAKFLLKPRGCVHREEIGATVRYKDHSWEKHTLDMRPKEIHCVCPFLKEKAITRSEFLRLYDTGYSAEHGLNFENISPEKLVEFLSHTCKNRLYKVDEFSIENGKVLYLAGESPGEKAYYLLTAVVQEEEGIVRVLLHANSDKAFGINGFLNEILENLRHLVQNAGAAREIGIIKKEQVINIIDSVVQHTNFAGGTDAPSLAVRGSVVQRSKIGFLEEEEEKAKKTEQTIAEKTVPEQTTPEQTTPEKTTPEKAVRHPPEKKAPAKEPLSRSPEKKPDNPPKKTIPVLGLMLIGILLAGASAVFLDWGGGPGNPETYTNSIGMEFVLVPEGEFMMGSSSGENGADTDERPLHKVTIGEPFYLGKYEVTQEQWQKVMGNNPSYFKGDRLPVEGVSWEEAREFIQKLNGMEKTDKYRLPSEAEWEYACRAGSSDKYSFNYDVSSLEEYAWYDTNSGDKTHPVGQKNPNPWGLYDMHGNVWEWVQDGWHDSYYGAPSDGSARESSSNSLKVRRGGSWEGSAGYCRAANRGNSGSGYRSSGLGFRVLREL